MFKLCNKYYFNKNIYVWFTKCSYLVGFAIMCNCVLETVHLNQTIPAIPVMLGILNVRVLSNFIIFFTLYIDYHLTNMFWNLVKIFQCINEYSTSYSTKYTVTVIEGGGVMICYCGFDIIIWWIPFSRNCSLNKFKERHSHIHVSILQSEA